MALMQVTGGGQPSTIHERIRWARVNVGLSQERFAEKIGTSRRHVMRWEKGTHVPGVEYARRIAEATGTRPEMFGEAEDGEEDD